MADNTMQIHEYPKITELQADDLLIADRENDGGELFSIKFQNLLDQVLKEVPDNGSGDTPEPAESVVKVPFIYGYSVLVRDYEVTIPSGKNTIVFGSLDDFGITMEDIVNLSIFCISSNVALDYTVVNKAFHALSYAGTSWSSAKPITVRVCIIVKNDRVDLPYIYGYKMITKEFDVIWNGSRVAICNILTDFDLESSDDMVGFSVIPYDNNGNIGTWFTFDPGTNSIISVYNHELSGADSYRVSLIVRDETKTPASALDISSLETVETIEETDKFLINTGEEGARENKAITALDFMNNMAGYLPKGVKCITKEFEVTNPTAKAWKVCNISDFGIDDISKVVNLFVKTDERYIVYYAMDDSGDITAVYYETVSSDTLVYTVSLFVKDYSDIGSEIVTENVKIITKKDVELTFSGQNSSTVIPLDDIVDVSFEDIINIAVMSADENNGVTIFSYVRSDGIHFYSLSNMSSGTKVNAIINFFVRTPVVEQLPRFTKDVSLSLNSGNGYTGIVLDGSEEAGGYTIDNFHEINAIGLNPTSGCISGIWLTENHEIVINSLSQPAAYGIYRISIE